MGSSSDGEVGAARSATLHHRGWIVCGLPGYAWAFFPNTLLGILLLPLAAFGGGCVRRRDGIVEAHGPPLAWLLERSTPLCGGAAALTLGHVVVARDRECLERSRAHERVHVRQYERWGPFFLPAYLLSSLLAFARGRDPYRDNRFEREAFRDEHRS